MAWWYLSFSSDEDGGFLGAAVVEANDMVHAVHRCHELRINPGGEALGLEIGVEDVAMQARNRLLSKREVMLYMGPVQCVDSNGKPLRDEFDA